MATSEAGVCNIALLRIGQRGGIDSLDEPTEAARACKFLFADARDLTLRGAWWKFATRRAALAPLANITRTGWSYVYAWPADCLTPRFIWPGLRNPSAENRVPFDTENDAQRGNLLLSDAVTPELFYTFKHTSVGQWPPEFVDALAWRLAADLARGLVVKPALGDAMDKRAEFSIQRAAALELRKGQEDEPPEAEFIRVRG